MTQGRRRGSVVFGGKHPVGKWGRENGRRRAVKEARKERVGTGRVPPIISQKIGAAFVAQTPPKAVHLGGITRERADRQLVADLQAMLNVPQKQVGLLKRCAFGRGQQPGVRQCRKRVKRVAAAQGGIGPARDKLHELHRKLDIPDAADAFFDVDVGVARPRDFLFQPPLVGLDAFNKRLFHPRSVDECLGHFHKRCADFSVPGHEPRLQERLPLPGFRPGLIIRAARRHRPRDRPEPAFGPQPQVHPEDKSGVGDFCESVPHRLAELHRVARRHGVAVDENQINVRCIIQLLPAQLPQRKHGKRRVRKFSLFGADLERHADADIGEIADGPDRFRHVGIAEQIPRPDPQHFRRLEAAQSIPPRVRRLRNPDAPFQIRPERTRVPPSVPNRRVRQHF